MTHVYHHTTPSSRLIGDLLSKVNAHGSQPKILVEVDKVSYVPGLKQKRTVTDWIQQNSIKYIGGALAPQVIEPGNRPTAPGEGTEPEVGTERYTYILCAANKSSQEWNIEPYDAVPFLMAIARHETGYGTLGMGRKSRGSFILGYGCPTGAQNCTEHYQGILNQMHYGAKRFAEAMPSKYTMISRNQGLTREDVKWFHEGGDKGYGRWVWSEDRENWINRVWQYYQENRNANMNCHNDTLARHLLLEKDDNVPPVKYTLENKGLNQLSGLDVKPVFPLQGESFTSRVRVTSHSSKNKAATRTNHKGIDMNLNTSDRTRGHGTPVVASWAGQVVRVRNQGDRVGYGKYVIVRHANGWETLYAHLDTFRVSLHQTVKAGDVVGTMGNTGGVRPTPTRADPYAGTHLHFEIWRNGWVSGGNSWIDPYPVLNGAQSISQVGYGEGHLGQSPELVVEENIVFNKCFKSGKNLSSHFVHTEDIEWFSIPQSGEKAIGYTPKMVRSGQHKGFAFGHRFSHSGYFEYALYLDLKEGDYVTVRLNGVTVAIYDQADSSNHITYADPIPFKLMKEEDDEEFQFNSHLLDFHLESTSGKATFGLVCLKVGEVEVTGGTSVVTSDIEYKTMDRWYDIGAFVYDDTFFLEEDIMDWEVNTHFDMQSSTARITLDNSSGVYSPNYERTDDFPDNCQKSPYSYYENGKLQHVLGEGAPVRIYAGYGEEMVRIFTGTIKGEIEEDSQSRTIRINFVDTFNKLEEFVFPKPYHFPEQAEDPGHTDELEKIGWVKSSIVNKIIRDAGMTDWRYHGEDQRYPDFIIRDTYYIDIDRGKRKAVKMINGVPEVIELDPEKGMDGYMNPYIDFVEFPIGTKASDAIQELIKDIPYRAYCDRYGTFYLDEIDQQNNTIKWEFIDGENLYSLSTSIDYSSIRNHLMITSVAGGSGRVDHFFDLDLLISTKGEMRTGGVQADWIDERFGATARGQKEAIAKTAFFDMKRRARTFNAVIKGNPMIDIMDGCYIYDQASSTAGYYVVKGNRLVGNREGMLNFLELTWENTAHEEQRLI